MNIAEVVKAKIEASKLGASLNDFLELPIPESVVAEPKKHQFVRFRKLDLLNAIVVQIQVSAQLRHILQHVYLIVVQL